MNMHLDHQVAHRHTHHLAAKNWWAADWQRHSHSASGQPLGRDISSQSINVDDLWPQANLSWGDRAGQTWSHSWWTWLVATGARDRVFQRRLNDGRAGQRRMGRKQEALNQEQTNRKLGHYLYLNVSLSLQQSWSPVASQHAPAIQTSWWSKPFFMNILNNVLHVCSGNHLVVNIIQCCCKQIGATAEVEPAFFSDKLMKISCGSMPSDRVFYKTRAGLEWV